MLVANPRNAPTALVALRDWNVTGALEISLYRVWGSSPLEVLALGAVKTTLALKTELSGSSACF